MYSSQCQQACVTRLVSVTWRKRLQGKSIELLLFVVQPKEEIFGLQQGQLLRLELEVYGTVWGSANWRETIRQYILELCYVQTRADACAFILKLETYATPKQLQTPFNDTEWLTSKDTGGEGRELVATDGRITLVAEEVMNSGNERHQTLTRRLRKRFRFGKYRTVQCDEGGAQTAGGQTWHTKSGEHGARGPCAQVETFFIFGGCGTVSLEDA